MPFYRMRASCQVVMYKCSQTDSRSVPDYTDRTHSVPSYNLKLLYHEFCLQYMPIGPTKL